MTAVVGDEASSQVVGGGHEHHRADAHSSHADRMQSEEPFVRVSPVITPGIVDCERREVVASDQLEPCDSLRFPRQLLDGLAIAEEEPTRHGFGRRLHLEPLVMREQMTHSLRAMTHETAYETFVFRLGATQE